MNEVQVVESPKVRGFHDRVAMLLGAGRKPSEVADELGINRSRVSELRRHDWFKALEKRYRDKAEFIEFQAFRQVVTVQAECERLIWDEIQERLMDHPEKFSNRDLLELQADIADRSGRSKVSRTESTSVNIDLADALADARRRELKLSASGAPPSPDEGGLVTSTSEGPAP